MSLIEEKQIEVIRMQSNPSPSEISPWEIPSISEELLEIKNICEKENPDWLIVDHYGLSIEWETTINKLGIPLLVIDDLFRQHHCEALLDQNFNPQSAERYSSLVPNNAKLFLGPEYALLSKSFQATSPQHRDFNKIESILLSFGGSDPDGETVKALTALQKHFQDIRLIVVVGRANPFIPQIQKIAEGQLNTELHIQTSQMAELMNRADLYLGAGGSTTWERCYLGLPGICVATAENQFEISSELANQGVHLFLGYSKDLDGSEYIQAISNLKKNHDQLKKYSENSLALGVGSKTKEILELFK